MNVRPAVVVPQDPESLCDQVLDRLFEMSHDEFPLREQSIDISVDGDDSDSPWMISDTFVHYDSTELNWECLIYRESNTPRPSREYIKVQLTSTDAFQVIQAVVTVFPGEYNWKSPNLQVLSLLAQ